MGCTLAKDTTPSFITFQDLPCEIKVRIFSELSLKDLLSVARVCKSWKDLAYQPSLWKSVSLSFSSNVDAKVESIKTGMKQRCTMLRSIALNDVSTTKPWRETTVRMLFAFLTFNHPDIEDINLTNFSSLTAESLCLLSKLKKLKSLSLNEDFGNDYNDVECVSFVLQSCSCLETLDLPVCYLTSDMLQSICTCLDKTLRNLTINSSLFDDDDIGALQNCQNLNTLALFGCIGLTDACFHHLKNLHNLKDLQLFYNDTFTSRGFSALCSGAAAESLEYLRLESIYMTDEESLLQMLTECRNLKMLVVRGPCKITESNLESIQAEAKRKQCKSDISLPSCTFTQQCRGCRALRRKMFWTSRRAQFRAICQLLH